MTQAEFIRFKFLWHLRVPMEVRYTVEPLLCDWQTLDYKTLDSHPDFWIHYSKWEYRVIGHDQ